MMAECFSGAPPQLLQPGSGSFNRAMEEAMLQQRETEDGAAAPKRSKTTGTADAALQTQVIPVPDSAPALPALPAPPEPPLHTAPQSEDAAPVSQPAPLQRHAVEMESEVSRQAPPDPPSSSPAERAPASSEPASLPPEPVPQDEEAPREGDVTAKDEEFPRENEIIRAMERRSQQLERLVKSHQTLSDMTQKLMAALMNRQT
ncbi:unnamed protein product [Phytophthora fragariaefolia]|uniref:Unnamed protein product n=1 Tax=Phytophthora fragariaefolia TaxID=1490495 RepID=A0A9W6U3G8_9STRA|nr:unnamed protein product [Phytophthora fragariaefolia]